MALCGPLGILLVWWVSDMNKGFQKIGPSIITIHLFPFHHKLPRAGR